MINADFSDLIHIQFREKEQALHSNYIAQSFNFMHILSIMLPGIAGMMK
jgi:hypothetical protein